MTFDLVINVTAKVRKKTRVQVFVDKKVLFVYKNRKFNEAQ
jgi:hypothetical protein